MRRPLFETTLLLASAVIQAFAVDPPGSLVVRTGDQSIVLHWDRSPDPTVVGYRVYRAEASNGPFTALTSNLVTSPGYCDLSVTNGQTCVYQVTAALSTRQESAPSGTLTAVPQPFATDDDFLEYIQQVHFDYFWYLANPSNGLIPDRTAKNSACSTAAVGFGLTAIGIGIDHGWITRTQGVARVLTTLNTFFNGPQGSAVSGMIGYNGWFYHFLNMNTAVRTTAEVSSIDTAMLLAGILYAKQYFDRRDADEASIRSMADAIFQRVNWTWMARGSDRLSLGWMPETGFIANSWIGYNEGSILYLLGLGAGATNTLPDTAWSRWTTGYTWHTYYGLSLVPFAPLFAHQYTQCWIDLRHQADSYMAAHQSTYFENSRRATLAQRQYCIINPNGHAGYSSNVWGLTACDGPSPLGYSARGAPAGQDDGTIAPTAAGGSIAFAPEYSVPTLRYFYNQFRSRIWTAYGFRDSFNLGAQYWDSDELGIDQGPIVLMIENYRTQRPWQRFMRSAEAQRGLQRAGFSTVPFVTSGLQIGVVPNGVNFAWDATAGANYQVEYSPDLETWFMAPGSETAATSPLATWTDMGVPDAMQPPFNVPYRFYRVFRFGAP
jgi:hypothetical protein